MAATKTRMSRGEKRPIAGREEILSAARAIGVCEGWKALTIRSVAQKLGYASPLLYEHFRDKEDLLTQIAVDALRQLEAKLIERPSSDPRTTVASMTERYWTFMLEHTQLYRLVNGMDGVPVDKNALSSSAQSICKLVAEAVRPLLAENVREADAQVLADELWALLHGMAALYMDRVVPFDLARVTNSVMKLIRGARIGQGALRPRPRN